MAPLRFPTVTLLLAANAVTPRAAAQAPPVPPAYVPPAYVAPASAPPVQPAPAPFAPPPGEAPLMPPAHGPLHLVFQTEGAVGVTPGPFYNHLVGVRLDYAFTPSFSLGPYLAYANLKGPDGGRTHNALGLVTLSYRAVPKTGSALGIPFRFSSGYLPKNGPVLRGSVGLSYASSDRLEFSLDLLSPTVWIVRGQGALSLDVALEVNYAL